jgi:predicted ArsR family transcriptional regulator
MMQEQSYPDHPGYLGRTETIKSTGREAAEKIAPLAKTIRTKVLAALKKAYPAGLSSDQIANEVGIIRYSVRSRISELVASGEVEPTDQRTKNGDGNSVVIWRAVNE